MKKLMQTFLLSLALCGGTVIQNDVLHAMRSPIDGLEAPASFGRAMEKFWWRAVEGNHPYAIRGLLFCGIDPNITNGYGNNALMAAIRMDYTEIVRLFIDVYKNTPYADFLNCRNDDGDTALVIACGTRSRYLSPAREEALVDIVTQLINAGVDLNAQNKHGQTALITALVLQNEHIAHLLLDAHADVNIQDAHGDTALIEAAAWGHTSVVRHLLAQQNININAKNKGGWTALMWAAIWNRLEIVRLLVLAGAERDIENFKHHNVYYLVEERLDLLPWQKKLLQIALSLRPFPQNPEKNCAICCEEDGGEFTLLELCGHYFHTGCLNNWLRVKKSCPLCRSDVPFHDRTFFVEGTEEKKEAK